MGKKDPKPGTSGKRPLADDDDSESSASKKLLASNPFARLENGATPVQPPVEKKIKMPPFYVKGRPVEVKRYIDAYILKGLKVTIVLCSEGYKLLTPSEKHYSVVEAILKKTGAEYYSHDIEANKPFKVVLRGLPDMEVQEVKDALTEQGLKPVDIFKMARHDSTRKFRDQLYLVHLERHSTGLKQLNEIRSLLYYGVKWEHYKPAHRDVTQCMKCLHFGHGTKNCHMAPRCLRCGENHSIDVCERMEEAEPICANCGAEHKATNKTCPKRAEYIEVRKRASTGGQPGRKRPKPPAPKDPAPQPTPTPTPVKIHTKFLLSHSVTWRAAEELG